MAAIQLYKISVPDREIDRLKTKLSLAEFPGEVDFADDWNYGAPLADIKRLTKLWQDDFDWRAAEARLNELPQYTTTISVDGHGDLQIHFVHQKSSKLGGIPLLFSHGWPGSFIEVKKLLRLLTNADGDGPAFDLVAPSLPNFGFSNRTAKKGFGIPQYAEVCHKLMLQLGYDKYVTQGGDWGYTITRMMGLLYPQNVVASHLNYTRGGPPRLINNPLAYLRHAVGYHTEEEKAGLKRTAWFKEEGYGYNIEQSTRPHTIGFALADSPVALLAWIYEKLHDWTDSYPWTDDEVLTWVSIYAFSTAGPDASVRIYYETVHSQLEVTNKANNDYLTTPLGISYFPRDLVVPPSGWARALGPLVFERRHTDGGHFAAYERPEALARDLREMFGNGGGAEKIAKRFRGQ